MADLRARFAGAKHIPAPELWREIERREPNEPDEEEAEEYRPRRWVAALVALAVAAAGIGFAVFAFRPGSPSHPAATPGVRAEITFSELTPTRGQNLYAANSGGGNLHLVANLPIDIFDASWSPDGSKVAFAGSQRSGKWVQIFVMDADGSHLVRLTSGPYHAWEPAWSPYGSEIAFRRDVGSGEQIWVMDADGTGQRRVSRGSGFHESPSWSPDGSQIAYAGKEPHKSWQVYAMNADGADPHAITHDPASSEDRAPAWSPDGTKIAYVAMRSGRWGVQVVGAGGSGEQRLADTGKYGSDPSWSPDGSMIAFERPVGKFIPLFVMYSDGTNVRQVTPDSSHVCCASWRPLGSPGSPTPTGSASPTPTSPPATPLQVGSVDTFNLPARSNVSSITYGFGSVWVAASSGASNTLFRIDPTTGRVIDQIATPTGPSWETGGGGLMAADGSIWLTGQHRNGALLLRIDPGTDRVAAEVPLPGGLGADIAWDRGGVWVMSFLNGPVRVSQVDPGSNRVVATVVLPQVYAHYLVAAGGSIVAAANDNTKDVVGRAVLNVIDPSSATVARTIPLGGYAVTVANGMDLWVLEGSRISAVDPNTGSVAEVAAIASTGDVAAAGNGGIWFLEPQDRSALYRLNPGTGKVESVPLPRQAGPVAIAPAPGALWLLNYEGTVTRVVLGEA